MIIRNVAIIGGGALGTALAINLAKKLSVTLVPRSAMKAEELQRMRVNRQYLPEVRFPDQLRVTHVLADALADADLVMIATPVSAFKSVITAVAAIRRDLPMIWGSKGFCPVTGELLSVEAARTLGPDACYGVISGPSFAEGLAANDPTTVVVATNANRQTTLRIAESLSNDSLRVYANSDLTGVQICGAIKNVYAIAAGIIDGCGWGENTRAAMMTRAIAEANVFLKKHQAKRSTLMGLSGFGDFYLTCGSRLSRNYQVGLALASGSQLDEVLASLGHVAEGVQTARLICLRAATLGIEMPIAAAANEILDGLKTPRECAVALMARDIKYEKLKRGASPNEVRLASLV